MREQCVPGPFTINLLLYRLTKEYEKLIKDLPKGVNVYLPCETDIYSWEATIDGPEDSLYKGEHFEDLIFKFCSYGEMYNQNTLKQSR